MNLYRTFYVVEFMKNVSPNSFSLFLYVALDNVFDESLLRNKEFIDLHFFVFKVSNE